jgi:acetyl-CoA acetyltransferase
LRLGRSDIIFAGGVESMSKMPLLFGEDMTELFINLMGAKTPGDKLKVLKSSFRFPTPQVRLLLLSKG